MYDEGTKDVPVRGEYEGMKTVSVQREYKSTVFTMLYSDKAKLLQLYNAVNGTDYTNEADLEFTTLENAVYVTMKNDISFIVGSQLSLYEHQSTVNPNMPLRDLLYISHVIQALVEHCNLYGRKLVKIPTPRFVVFYNGTERQPARKVIKLSEAFAVPLEEPELELMVTVLNVNEGLDDGILATCRELREYSQFVAMVREFAEYMPIEEAVKRAVDECIRRGILADFLRKNKAEAIAMSIFEFDREKYDAGLREEGYEDGVKDGEARGLAIGEAKGDTRRREKTIYNLLKRNMPLEEIAEIVELSVEEVQALISDNGVEK